MEAQASRNDQEPADEGAAETRALTIARTESLRAFRASRMTFAENSDSLDGWIWLSANNKRTCVSCLAISRPNSLLFAGRWDAEHYLAVVSKVLNDELWISTIYMDRMSNILKRAQKGGVIHRED